MSPRAGRARPDVGNGAAERVHDLRLANEAEGGDVIARPPRADGLEPRRLPPRDGPGHEDVLRAPPREVARELAEGAFGLALTGQDLALDHDLRRGGDVEIQRRAGSNLEGLAEEPTHHLRSEERRVGKECR